jgi:hypothetical protein
MGYPGGKSAPGTFHRIISLMPPHRVYIEPFMGGFSIGKLKRPAALNIGIDRDHAAVERAMPPAESQVDAIPAADAGECEIRRRPAPNAAISADAAESGDPAGLLSAASGSARAPSLLYELPDPLARTVDTSGARWLFNEDDGIEFLRFVSTWWHRMFRLEGPVLIYCDPPYMRHTCASKCRYKFDMTDVDHHRLLRVLLELNALPDPPMLMISGYDSTLYRERLEDWNHLTFEAMTRGGKKATEHLWFNFAPPVELHDSRYVGKNWRDRERIKRRQQTWIKTLKRLQPYEREALLAAIADTAGTGEVSSR